MPRQRPSLAGVNINLVVALHALLEEQHVSRAAHVGGLGQSSMSYALARLRAHFDDRPLVPDGRRMVWFRGAIKRAIEEARTRGSGSPVSSNPRRTHRSLR